MVFDPSVPNFDAISNGYRPETEATDELRPVNAAYYQFLIGILWWVVELGRADICV